MTTIPTMLLSYNFPIFSVKEFLTSTRLAENPFTGYAAEHWVVHAPFGGRLVKGMKLLFDASKPQDAVWLGIPLHHYAAFCSLHTAAKFLAIEHPQDMHSRGIDNEPTPLLLASRDGHMEVACVLVEHGAGATPQDKVGWTPMNWASANGHLDVARFLIEHSADAISMGQVHFTSVE